MNIFRIGAELIIDSPNQNRTTPVVVKDTWQGDFGNENEMAVKHLDGSGRWSRFRANRFEKNGKIVFDTWIESEWCTLGKYGYQNPNDTHEGNAGAFLREAYTEEDLFGSNS